MSERVLVFPEDILLRLPTINGISLEPIPYGEAIFSDPATTFIERDLAEKTPEWKQVIPYLVIQHEDTYLVYQRTTNGGETRLHGKFSLGIGGHIKNTDGIGVVEAYLYGMARELYEEIEVDALLEPTTVKAAIYDDSTDVGKVHFGFVYILPASSKKAVIRDPAIGNATFVPVEFLKGMRDQFESWSQLVIDHVL